MIPEGSAGFSPPLDPGLQSGRSYVNGIRSKTLDLVGRERPEPVGVAQTGTLRCATLSASEPPPSLVFQGLRSFALIWDAVSVRDGTILKKACLCLLASCLSSCGPRPPQPIVLRVADWSGAGSDSEFDRLVQSFLRKFERENPGVRVQREGVPGEYKQKMLLDFVAGTMPDVMMVDASSAAAFVDTGALRDLGPFIARDRSFRLDDYYPNVVDIGRRGSKLFMIPGDFTPMAVYYNKELFDRARVPYPRAGWNFAQFRETAKRLTLHGKQFGFAFTNWMPGWVMWLWNNGGDVVDPTGRRAEGYLDSDPNSATLAFLRDLIVKDGSAPSLSQAEAQGVDLFANGQAAMTVSGHWSLVGYREPPKDSSGRPKIDWTKLGVVEMPHNTPSSNTVMYEAGFGISTNSKHPDLAWKFVRMWTSYEFQSRYNRSGIAVSARVDVSRQRAKEQLIEAQFTALVPSARPPYGCRIEDYEFVETRGQAAMDSILNEGAVPKRALHDAAHRVDLEFAKD